MRKLVVIPIILILVGIIVFSGCANQQTSTTQTTTQSSSTQPTATSTSSAPKTTAAPPSTAVPTVAPVQTAVAAALNGPIAPEGTPVPGGTLRRIESTFPRLLGYPPEFGPGEGGLAYCLERLLQWDEHGNLIPVLAESWDGDPTAMTITWHLRKGVKFTDGTDWNAAALKWNYEQQMGTGRLTEGQYVKSLEVVDDYTLVMHLTTYDSTMFENYGWAMMASPTAFQNAGTTDDQRIAWARLHPVGTGPYMLTEFQRDTVIKWKKNPNYWRTGMPYYDGIEDRLIPDPMTAEAMMRAGQADMWSGGTVQGAKEMEKLGFKVNWGIGLAYILAYNSTDPNKPFSNIKVREAIEYAIDRPTLANMLGLGTFEPFTQLAGKNFPAYNPGFDPRPFDPAKAKELLAEAGYPDGFKTTLLTGETTTDAATAIQGYLKAVGIDASIDVADRGRYLGEMFNTGWPDIALTGYGVNPDATDLFVHFGPNPMTYKSGTMYKSPEYLALFDQALHIYNSADLIKKEQEIVRQASADAMVTPLYATSGPVVMQPYVHSSYGFIHLLEWNTYQEWMDPH